MIEAFAKLIPAHLYDRSGKVFYSGSEAFERRSPLYVLGLNPGGCPERQAEETVGRHVGWLRDSAPRNWSAYRDERWGRPEGEAPMQKRVRHMFARLGRDPATVPSSNVVFVRSRRANHLGKGEFERVAADCWPFHQAVVETLGVRVVACLGTMAGSWLRKQLAAERETDRLVEKNNRRWTSRTYRSGSGLAVVVLTHPGVADWRKPRTDPTELIERALE